VIEDGWTLWHEPASSVLHSHPYTLRQLFGRNVDDGVANRDINDRSLSESEVLPLVRALVLDDWTYLIRELQLAGEELEQWQIDAVLRRAAQVVGQWIGVNHRELPDEVVSAFSGVSQARRSR
jgi:hypothetical protein